MMLVTHLARGKKLWPDEETFEVKRDFIFEVLSALTNVIPL